MTTDNMKINRKLIFCKNIQHAIRSYKFKFMSNALAQWHRFNKKISIISSQVVGFFAIIYKYWKHKKNQGYTLMSSLCTLKNNFRPKKKSTKCVSTSNNLSMFLLGTIMMIMLYLWINSMLNIFLFYIRSSLCGLSLLFHYL